MSRNTVLGRRRAPVRCDGAITKSREQDGNKGVQTKQKRSECYLYTTVSNSEDGVRFVIFTVIRYGRCFPDFIRIESKRNMKIY